MSDDLGLPTRAQQPLRAALVENRDDLASWTVLGDLLQSEGDPRGTLVTLMLERERAPSQKLYDTELAYRKQHLAKLLPAFLRRSADSIAWRRGFPSAIPIESADVLARALEDASLAFVESVRLDLSIDEWEEACAAIDGKQLPWRRARIAISGASEDDELELATWLTAMPRLERLDIAFGQYEEARLAWTDATAPHLRCISIENATEVGGLADADLPALAEVIVLGTTPAEDLDGVTVRQGGAAADDDDWSRQEAFIAIRRLVDVSVVEEVAHATLAVLSRFVVETGHIPAGPFTVLRTRGFGATQLMPYGLAVALERVLPPQTPIVLFHSSERADTARGFALGAHPVRRMDGASRGAMVLRSLFDVTVGHDPGPDLLDDLVNALAGATQTARGTGRLPDVLTDIDPMTLGRVPEPDDFYELEVEEFALELYTPSPEDAQAATEGASTIESPSLVETIVELEDEGEDDEVIFIADDLEDEPDDDEAPDGHHAWLRLLSEWAARIADPDDEYAERSRDPELAEVAAFDFDNAPGDGACHDCMRAHVVFYACTSCGGQHCGICTAQAEDGTVWCGTCIQELRESDDVAPLPGSYDDEVYDAEIMPPPELVIEEELADVEEWA